MSISSIGATPPLPPVGSSTGAESRNHPTASALREAATEKLLRTEKPKAADPTASAAEKPRANGDVEQNRDQVKIDTLRQLAAKSGLIEGSFEPFIDIIDPRYQTRIARVFGPEAGGPAPDAAPARAATKAYEAADQGAISAFAKNA
jgi:hypothetical protein